MGDEQITIYEVPVFEEEIIIMSTGGGSGTNGDTGANGADATSAQAPAPAPTPAPAPVAVPHQSSRTIVRSPPHYYQPGPTIVI